MNFIDITGQRFGRLVAAHFERDENPKKHKWLCRCDCGNTSLVNGYSLKCGDTQSCGCHRKEVTRARSIIHGHTANYADTTEYQIWGSMIKRCENPKAISYKFYGARGITVCPRWRNSFAAFFEDMGQRPDGMTLDRIESSGPYEKSNCRWADAETQAANRRPRSCRRL